ncbi:NADPH-dependent F420 reductase [Umezawaea endophytica]|uniref:NAD(P)-binding domain-containing protein n=1 Tax=Umezawaea endophytica TaxID=1654476 RepID=A0A9X2VPU5_9PSEU|nr:NAD(P)-binding domain-containing protein [Umezawaea endophytica]MCS7480666.1 NAD(P)-binding domain-containing protein [Umezawaea endophytica]
MSTVGLIGAGLIGGTVARLAVAAGHDVVLSNSRGPETLADLVAELGPKARAGTPAEAAEAGDVVVVTVPLKAYRDVPVEPLAGKVVIDTNNYYPERDGVIAELEDGSATTSGLLQAHLPTSKVVKVFNSIYYRHLADLPRPSGAADRSALPVAADDAGAKTRVAELLDDLGYDAHDAGTLAESWRFENGAPAYCVIYFAPGTATDDRGLPGAQPASAEVVSAALAKAHR